MAKYGDLIRKARETETQETSEPDNQLPVKPDDQIADKPDSQNSEETENQIASQMNNQLSGKPDNQITVKPEREVNLCVKVPESLRRHWAAEAKRQGITMTEVMTEALTQRFGKPDNQITR